MRVFLNEWRGRLYSPHGLLERYAAAENAKLDRDSRPVDEGLYDMTVSEEAREREGAEPKIERVMRFTPVYDQTPPDEYLPFGRVGFLLDGDKKSRWPTGFTAIVGPAASGKTRLAPLIAQREGGYFVTFGEPAPSSHPYSPTAYSKVLNHCLTWGKDKLCVVDSMRMATLSGGGQLGPGGIPRDMGSQISQIDYAARLAGRAVFGVINLLTSDPRAVESALEVLTGSCTAVLQTESVTDRAGDVRVVGTAVIRPADRQPTAFAVSITK